ncbi:site-specific integrase [Cyanobacteria bacterium FACHB-63]|nr:site-specific integrase [Cyanobacteria bacterium FACHB-63]
MNLDQLNDCLKAAKLGVVVEARGKGSMLSLRAKLPPRTGTGEWYRQYISLGIFSNPAGIKKAGEEAKKLAGQLACKEFNWNDWVQPEKPELESISAWIERFEVDYFTRRSRNPKSETTWETEYDQVFRQLPPDEAVTPELLRSFIEATEPDTRTRRRYCMVLGKLAEFAGIDLNVKPLRGKYGSKGAKRVYPRDLPSDKKISEWRDLIYAKSESWGYAFGLMACYGLRNHELFYIDLEKLKDSPVLSIIEHDNGNEPKTGERRVWAVYPEWWDKWQLWNVSLLPQVTGKNNRELGHRVTAAFRRYGFRKPYNLRHRWAVRTIEFGLPVELAAQQMGHSYKEHTNTYHYWITDEVHQRAYDLLMQRDDRPLPP